METKVCSRADCPHKGEPQPLANFYFKNRKTGWRHSECKTCHCEDLKARNHRDPQRARARVRKVRTKRDTPEGVQRNTLYVRAYRARQRAERGAQ